MCKRLPILLTWFRIFLIPIIVVIYLLPFADAKQTAAILFIIAAVTDLLDGFLARKMNHCTDFGAFLDPVADKVLVAVCLVLLLRANANLLLVICSMVIISREIIVSALREWLAELGQRSKVAVNFVGKVKTALQLIGITILLWYHPTLSIYIYWLGLAVLTCSAALTLWSMIIYWRAAQGELSSEAIEDETDQL